MKTERDSQMIESQSVNGVAATWLAITFVVLIAPVLHRVTVFVVPALLIVALGASGICSLRALAEIALAGKHSETSRGLLLHVSNLATVCAVVIAGTMQMLAQHL
ncbi:MAG: hypothetical protein CMJ64_07970 [Planctomycetaceae bacterium]|nr:hypothetical protein [Planctomycetaceae bacterium]